MPIYGGDFTGEARKLSSTFRDKRVSYFLDTESETAKQFQPVLKTPSLAWDVYLLYGPGAGWQDHPPDPTFWMHQLGPVTSAPRLDQATFTAKLKDLLSELKPPPAPVPHQ